MTDSHIGLSMSTSNGKSAMAGLARPPDNPPPGDEWKKIPGVKDWYEFSHRGLVRSLDHSTNGRDFEGKVLSPRLDGDGYEVVNVTYVNGARKNGASVARLVLLAHAGEPPDPAMQACHGPGGQRDNRWPENLRWGTDEENRADWRRDNPPRPKPLKACVRCGNAYDSPGRRCQPCLDELGCQAARRIADGEDDLDALAKDLDYPSPPGLFRLAVRRGGLQCTVEPVVPVKEANAALRGASGVIRLEPRTRQAFGRRDSPSWLRRVISGREASRQDNDAP